MGKTKELYNEVKRVVRWGYPGMDSYVMDIWELLAKGMDEEEIKKQILVNSNDLGIGPNKDDNDLKNVLAALKRIQPEIQKLTKETKK